MERIDINDLFRLRFPSAPALAPDGARVSAGSEALWRQSPLAYAHRAKTPTLFIHGAEDHRCDRSEAIQMFTALRYHGVESRLCLFEGENHELSCGGTPSQRVRRLQEILAWLDRWLRPDEGLRGEPE